MMNLERIKEEAIATYTSMRAKREKMDSELDTGFLAGPPLTLREVTTGVVNRISDESLLEYIQANPDAMRKTFHPDLSSTATVSDAIKAYIVKEIMAELHGADLNGATPGPKLQ
jgi:hypothetical protein